MFVAVLLAIARAAPKVEENGLAVIYSWGKVCINICEWDCAECLDWSGMEANNENSDIEYDEVSLENDDGTFSTVRIPLVSAKGKKKPVLGLAKPPRPAISKLGSDRNITARAAGNGCFEVTKTVCNGGNCKTSRETVCK